MGDLSDFHLPLRHVYRSALVEGHSILWTNKLFAGFYIHAEGQLGALHPLHVLLYRVLPLTVAFNLEIIASYVFCFAGMLLLLRRFGLTTAAGLIGAIAFTFSGFNLLHLLHVNAVAIVSHVPWLLLAFDGVLSGDSRRKGLSIIGLSLLTGSILLLGYPQYVWIAALICGIYVVMNGRRTTSRRLAIAAGSAAAGVMLGGVQLLPTIDLLGQSMRAATTRDFALTYSLHPLNLAQLFSPYLFTEWVYAAPDELFVHEFGIYNGVFCTLSALWVLLRWRHLPSRAPVVFAGALMFIGLLLALGRYGGVYEIVAMLPLVGTFRAPARHIVLVHLGFALLAAVAFDDIRRSSDNRRSVAPSRWIWLPLAASVGLPFVVWAWIATAMGFEGQTVSRAGVFIGAGMTCIVTLLLADARRGSRPALVLLPVILSVDLALWGYGYVWSGGVRTVREIASQTEGPPAEAGAGARLHAAETHSPNLLLLRGFGIARPYVGLSPRRALSLASSNELRVAGVEWVQNPDWRRVADPMSRVRIVPEWLLTQQPVSALSGIDVRRVGLVDRALPPLHPDATATAIADSAGRITADVSAPGHALLVTTEAYHPGWRATDGDRRELQTLRVYGDFLGVLLTPGEYRLALTFEPASMAAGIYTSVAGLASTLVLFLAARRLDRRSGRPSLEAG